jgi:hypothetical protein
MASPRSYTSGGWGGDTRGAKYSRTGVNKNEGTCTRPEPGADQGGEHGYGKPVTSGADDTLQDVLKTMTDQRVTDRHVRRLCR